MLEKLPQLDFDLFTPEEVDRYIKPYIDMAFRCREERKQAEARAFEHAKFGAVLHKALLKIVDMPRELGKRMTHDEIQRMCSDAIFTACAEFNYSLFKEGNQ